MGRKFNGKPPRAGRVVNVADNKQTLKQIAAALTLVLIFVGGHQLQLRTAHSEEFYRNHPEELKIAIAACNMGIPRFRIRLFDSILPSNCSRAEAVYNAGFGKQ